MGRLLRWLPRSSLSQLLLRSLQYPTKSCDFAGTPHPTKSCDVNGHRKVCIRGQRKVRTFGQLSVFGRSASENEALRSP